MAFAAEIDSFLDYLSTQRRVSSHTVDSYRRVLKKAQACLERETELKSFTEVDESAMRQILRELNFDDKAQRLSQNTAAHDLYALSSLYKYFIRQGLMESNPTELVKAPKVKRPLPRVLSEGEIETLIAACTGDKQGLRDRAMIELLFGAGLRVSELTSLDLSDLDFELEEVRVVGKGSKERRVPFGSYAVKALQAYLKARAEFKPAPDCKAVFLNRFGRRISTRAVEMSLNNLAKTAGVSGCVTPHKLRHSFASELLGGGADVRMVQEMLGHSSLAATQIYTHVNLERLRSIYSGAHPRDKMESS